MEKDKFDATEEDENLKKMFDKSDNLLEAARDRELELLETMFAESRERWERTKKILQGSMKRS